MDNFFVSFAIGPLAVCPTYVDVVYAGYARLAFKTTGSVNCYVHRWFRMGTFCMLVSNTLDR